jgi:ribosomal protein L27
MLGKDYTVFSTVEGIVVFDKKKEKPEVGPGSPRRRQSYRKGQPLYLQ